MLGIVSMIPMNEPVKDDRCVAQNNTFIDGETLVYKLYYNWKLVWIPAGEVKFTVREGQEYYE